MINKFFKETKKVSLKKYTLLNLLTDEIEVVITTSVKTAVGMGFYDVLKVEEVED